jgi:adenylate cyclase
MTPDQMKRKLAAILCADVKGYSRLMGEDEEGTIRTLSNYKEIMTGLILHHRGQVVGTAGDSLLADFASVVDAVRCAVEIQEELKDRNKGLTEDRRMEFRVGVNLGDVVEEGDTIYGDGVNVASRLESLAEAGGICISGMVYENIKNKLTLGYEYIGEQTVKNIKDPVRVYRVLMEPGVKKVEKGLGKMVKGKRALALGVLVAFVVIAAGVALWQFYLRPTPPTVEIASKEKMAFPLPDKPSIAVLPFVNLSGDPKQEFFSDGITEDIITALSKIPNLFVIARNSIFTYKGKPVKIKQVSEELGVRYVLEGSVQRSGDWVRITAQLIDALNGYHLWSERYDRELKDLFALQDEITIKIISAMQVKLPLEELTSTGKKHFKGKQDLDCYLKLLEGSYNFLLLTTEGNNMARRIGEEIVTTCPENAWGFNLLGWVYWRDATYASTKSPRESLEKAMVMAKKALAIDDTNAGIHGLLATIYGSKGEFNKAIAAGERTLALDPNGELANGWYADALSYANRLQEAIPFYEKAIRLNPIGSSVFIRALGACYRRMGRFEEAISTYRQDLLRRPNNISSHIGLTASYIAMGREKEDKAEAAEILRINPKFSLDNYAKFLAPIYKDQSELDNFIASLRKAGLK